MNPDLAAFLAEHASLTRRFFLRSGAAGVAAMSALPLLARGGERSPALQKVVDDLETWLTKQDDFQNVSRGTPKPYSHDEAKLKEVGMTRDTWKLEVVDDPDNSARLRSPLTKEKNTAFTFKDLMQLAGKHAVRFPKVMTCLNVGRPLGNGIWEGVPLREVLWLTQPSPALRRVFYYGYHNDDPKQMFRSSMPVNRVLEDLYDLPPVILCYKLNGHWLTGERGAPVRIVVPEAYGFKSIKWLSHVVLSNKWQSNDTYGEKNNDVDSPLKTFCDPISVPDTVKPNQPIALTGYAQVGIAGLKKVQVWIHNDDEALPADDSYFMTAPWRDAEIIPPSKNWGGDIANNRIPSPTHGFDPQTGQPKSWPMRLTRAHWAALLPGLPAGQYTLRCRTIDEKGIAQPMPRPFRKSGRAAIGEVGLTVEA
ncbi:MAG TPA: molybdopterin-dependent oxidoreductase [Pirellulaceae bacterium]|jgi:DMSO/TMAO reductase YedYZ molybdopterin-dependent catalytic subunit|nr:molybdopterin-dependent oxidoreductase [Pirellulaceae bacterium]